ncbi:hypothetical protein D3C80_1490850 [compost metagenome]
MIWVSSCTSKLSAAPWARRIASSYMKLLIFSFSPRTSTCICAWLGMTLRPSPPCNTPTLTRVIPSPCVGRLRSCSVVWQAAARAFFPRWGSIPAWAALPWKLMSIFSVERNFSGAATMVLLGMSQPRWPQAKKSTSSRMPLSAIGRAPRTPSSAGWNSSLTQPCSWSR